jgi:hypothetical protein
MKHSIEEKYKGMGRQGRRCKHLSDGLKEERMYWNLNQD